MEKPVAPWLKKRCDTFAMNFQRFLQIVYMFPQKEHDICRSLYVELCFEAESDKGSSDPAKSSVFGTAFAKLKAKAEAPLGAR